MNILQKKILTISLIVLMGLINAPETAKAASINVTSPTEGQIFVYGSSVAFSYSSSFSGSTYYTRYKIDTGGWVQRSEETYSFSQIISPGSHTFVVELYSIYFGLMGSDTTYFTVQQPLVDMTIHRFDLINLLNGKKVTQTLTSEYENILDKGDSFNAEIDLSYNLQVGTHAADFKFIFSHVSGVYQVTRSTNIPALAANEFTTINFSFETISIETNTRPFAFTEGDWNIKLLETVSYLGFADSQLHGINLDFKIETKFNHITHNFSDAQEVGGFWTFPGWFSSYDTEWIKISKKGETLGEDPIYGGGQYNDVASFTLENIILQSQGPGYFETKDAIMSRQIANPEQTGIIALDIRYKIEERAHIIIEGLNNNNPVWRFSVDSPYDRVITHSMSAWSASGINLLDDTISSEFYSIGFENPNIGSWELESLRVKIDYTDMNEMIMSMHHLRENSIYNPTDNLKSNLVRSFSDDIPRATQVKVTVKYYPWIDPNYPNYDSLILPQFYLDNYQESRYNQMLEQPLATSLVDRNAITDKTVFEYSETSYNGNPETSRIKIENKEIVGYKASSGSGSGWEHSILKTPTNNINYFETDITWNIQKMGIIRVWGRDGSGNLAWRAEVYDPWLGTTPKRILGAYRTSGTYTSGDSGNGGLAASSSSKLKIAFDDQSRVEMIEFAGIRLNLAAGSYRETESIEIQYIIHSYSAYYDPSTYAKLSNYGERYLDDMYADAKFLFIIDDGHEFEGNDYSDLGSELEYRFQNLLDMPIKLLTHQVTINWVEGLIDGGEVAGDSLQIYNALLNSYAGYMNENWHSEPDDESRGFDELFGGSRRQRKTGFVTSGSSRDNDSISWGLGGIYPVPYTSFEIFYNLAQHEISHLFGAGDHNRFADVMNHDIDYGAVAEGFHVVDQFYYTSYDQLTILDQIKNY